jgi:hypothetical protein
VSAAGWLAVAASAGTLEFSDLAAEMLEDNAGPLAIM